MNTIILVLLALIPAFLLCTYVFKKDRVEKEPMGLLLKLLVLGALSCIPVAFIESVFSDFINLMFSSQVSVLPDGITAVSRLAYYKYEFANNFVGIALVEELAKFGVLVWVTRDNKEFNSFFDGIIYAVFVSLGFAALENVLYVLTYGFKTALLRAVLSVPGHMFFAVFMGYHYSVWHVTEKAMQIEHNMRLKGLIPANSDAFSTTSSIVKCIVIPVLAHGLYDFCCTIGEGWTTLVFFAFVIFMYIHCFNRIRKSSKADGMDLDYVSTMIYKKYPDAYNKQ